MFVQVFRSRIEMIHAWCFLLVVSPAISAEETVKYNRDIRPILAENCFSCHGPDSASREADLRLDERDAAIELGALVPGEPDESELVLRLFTDDQETLMPPPETKKFLTDEEKQLLKRWVQQGGEYERHWSLIPPAIVDIPSSPKDGWAKNTIDQFVLAQLNVVQLKPAPEADPRTLFRRLHLDITGLPPQPGEVDAFEQDYGRDGDEALSRWIDSLMERPTWGEHRARYWLDAARYADTHGLHFDNYREMWPYRDWVIRSFNANQPFDQFTLEQIAGDLLPDPTNDQLVATGFQRCNMTTNEGGTIDAENLANYAADRVQTLGWVFLATTTNCAQCHDHKFDAITMQDYYSLTAFFRNTTQGPKDRNNKDGGGPVISVPVESDRARSLALPGEIEELTQQRDQRREDAKPAYEKWLSELDRSEITSRLPQQDLIVHLPMTEGQGNQLQNAVAGGEAFAAIGDLEWRDGGKFGKSATMKKGRTVNLESVADFEFDQPFTVASWIRAGKDNVNGGVIARMDQDADYRGWDLYQSGRKLAVHLIDTWPTNGIKVSTESDVLEPGQWQHVLVTYDGSRKPQGIHIYVNGAKQSVKVEKDTLKPEATMRTETPTRIGQRSGDQIFEDGSLQDVRIYGRVINDKEIADIVGTGTLSLLLATVDEPALKTNKALFEHYLLKVDPDFVALVAKVNALNSESAAIKERSPITHVQKERMDMSPAANILLRGHYDTLGDKVAAETPEALHAFPEGAPRNRLGLAQWLVDPANPLTARVTVNRFWQEVFGRGLVPTSEDFGVMGTPPSHPQLLDWLSLEFQSNGWNVKEFFKLMLMSATYRQSATVTAEKIEKDRDNAWLSRGPRFRMDAEMIRDYALATSGLLSPQMYGPGTRPYQPTNIWEVVGLPGGNTRKYVQDKGENLYRRSVYNFWKRMAPPPNLEAFNAPSREVCAVRRERTNTPLQALVTLNDPQFVEAARVLAEQAMLEATQRPDSVSAEKLIVDAISRRALGRSFTPVEEQLVLQNQRKLRDHYASHAEAAEKLLSVGEAPSAKNLSPVELAAWTLVCNQVLNLDEVLNK